MFALHKQKGDALSFPPDHAMLPKPIKTWTFSPSYPATGTNLVHPSCYATGTMETDTWNNESDIAGFM